MRKGRLAFLPFISLRCVTHASSDMGVRAAKAKNSWFCVMH